MKFAVHERYPIELAKLADPVTIDGLRLAFEAAKTGDPLRKLLNPLLSCGPSVIEHALLENGFPPNAKVGEGFDLAVDLDRLHTAVERCSTILDDPSHGGKGYIILKDHKGGRKGTATAETKDAGSTEAAAAVPLAPIGSNGEEAVFFDEFHPFLLKQHQNANYREFDSFDRAVDVFFSEMEAQKIDMRRMQKEQAALKKLENVKNDHERRLRNLKESQILNTLKAELVELNAPLVDKAIQVINSALASSMEWKAIDDMVAEAAARGDTVASAIASLKLDRNSMSMRLSTPDDETSESESDSSDDDGSGADAASAASRKGKKPREGKRRSTIVEIDLSMSAFANARALYDTKRGSAIKEKKTIEASEQALKNAEMKTSVALKQVQVVSKMLKTRKTYWFEKFLWFISSENFLIVGGRWVFYPLIPFVKSASPMCTV